MRALMLTLSVRPSVRNSKLAKLLWLLGTLFVRARICAFFFKLAKSIDCADHCFPLRKRGASVTDLPHMTLLIRHALAQSSQQCVGGGGGWGWQGVFFPS